MSTALSQFDLACRRAIREAGKLAPIGRDRIIANLRLQFEYPGEYVTYIDRIKRVKNTRRLIREVLAHSVSIADVQHPIDSASERDRQNIVVTYVDEADAGPQFLYELRGS